MTLTNLMHDVSANDILTPAPEMLQPHFHLLAPNHRRVTEAVQKLPVTKSGQPRVLLFCPFERKYLVNPTPALRPGWRLDAQIGSPATRGSCFPNLNTHGYRSTSVCMAIGARHPNGTFSYFHERQPENLTFNSLELVLLTTNEVHLGLARDSARAFQSFINTQRSDDNPRFGDVTL